MVHNLRRVTSVMAVAFRVRLLLVFAVVALAVGARSDGSTLVLPTDSSLIARSELVVVGRVLESTPVAREGKIWTETAISVEERLQGHSEDVVIVREPGGSLGGRATVVFGAPELTAGERVLLFLARAPEGAYRTVDLAAGKFSERLDRGGARFWFRDLRRSGLRVLDAADVPRSDLQREAATFERYVRGGAPDEGAYLRPFADGGAGEIRADFALAVEPKIQRWFSFEEGKPAGWVGVGRQRGYGGGGLQELAAAVAVWIGCPGAKIDYFLAGESAATPVGTRVSNGVNEVFFDDPLEEIPGSWNGKDGVVAIGGFDAVLAPRRWTAQFAADAAHPAGSFDAWAILEADVVVQDGVAPHTGIGSATLAEILAHELGHTLGLGHSSDSRALMYASLQNFGPYLRDDDRLAAQWLYPAPTGTSAPATLMAPSKLEVTSVTSESVRLAWNDNASGEAFQTIYYRRGGGIFSKLRDVAANVTVANLTGLTAGDTYEFQVTARGPAEESSPSNVAVAAVPRGALEASFTVAPTTGTAGITTFSIYDQSKGAIAVREWSFGDGAVSRASNPTRVYREAGTWEITLRVRDDRGEESVSSRTVTVAAPPPLAADFSWAPGTVAAGEIVRFADRSSGAPTGWAWSFGDGSSSSERDPSKAFDGPGRYAISLEITSGLQTARITRSLDVADATAGRLSAEFDVAPDVATAGEAVRFSATGDADSWSWDFGDGSSSSDARPSHAYTEVGTYLVTLEVRSGARSARSSRVLLVQDDESSLLSGNHADPKPAGGR